MKSRYLAILSLFILTVLLFSPSLTHDFIWDDIDHIIESPLVQAPDGLQKIWFSKEPVDYWPVSYTFFWIQWRLWGVNPAGYHFVNILIHAFSAVLLYLILKKLAPAAAFASALLFAIHPVQVESVAWIFQTKTTLAALFSFASLLLFFKHCQSKNIRSLLLSILFFGFALLSKSSAVMYPFAALAISFCFDKNWLGNIRKTAPFFIVALAFGSVSLWFNVNNSIGDDIVMQHSVLQKIIIASKSLWQYLYKVFVPVNLSFVYPRFSAELFSASSILALLSISGVIAYAIFMLRSSLKSIAAGFLLYLLFLVPVLGFIGIYFLRYASTADHYQYISMAPAAFFITQLCRTALDRIKPLLNGAFIKPAPILLFSTLAVMTFAEQRKFANVKALWSDTIRKNPSAYLALNNLGEILFQEGRYKDALPLFQRALHIEPKNTKLIYNLGQTYLYSGDPVSAARMFQSVIAIDSSSVSIKALAGAYKQMGHKDSSLYLYDLIIQRDPYSYDAHIEKGLLLYDGGDYERAVDCFNSAIGIFPDSASAHNNLGLSYHQLALYEKAEQHFGRALALRPGFAKAHFNLGNTKLAQKQTEKAIESFRRALAIDSRYIDARQNLASALFMSGDTFGALSEFQRALAMAPYSAAINFNIGYLYLNLGNTAAALPFLNNAASIEPTNPRYSSVLSSIVQ